MKYSFVSTYCCFSVGPESIYFFHVLLLDITRWGCPRSLCPPTTRAAREACRLVSCFYVFGQEAAPLERDEGVALGIDAATRHQQEQKERAAPAAEAAAGAVAAAVAAP